MTSDKAVMLLSTVLKRTNEGKLPWTETSTEDEFEASFPKQTLRVCREYDENITEFYTLKILSDGRLLDTIHPADLAGIYRGSAWKDLSLLYRKARDRALGVEQAVDDLIKELGGPPDSAGFDEDAALEEEIPF